MTTGGSDEFLVATLMSESDAERESALAELYRRHAQAVMGFAAACTGDRTVAEEVVEEVFIGLAREPRCFDAARETLRSYLVRLAHELCPEGPLDARPTGPWRELRREERVSLALVHFGGMTSDKVADFLGLPRETVDETIRSTLQRLRGGLP